MRIRVSEGVKQFKEKAEEAWKLGEWLGEQDPDKDLIFFGLYFQEDYDTFDKFKGNRYVFWCGSDILRTSQTPQWLEIVQRHEAKHFCETEIEAENLLKIGIKAEVIPSFLGNVYRYPISFNVPKEGENWKIWLCGHPGREKEYGFDEAKELVKVFDNVEVHLYGVEGKNEKNVFYHGLVKESVLDEEIKKYHCAIRANRHDGVSEVVIKALLLGQYPIARLPYEDVWKYESFGDLVAFIVELQKQVEPNYRPRIKWIQKINQFPWCYKNYWKPNE